MNVFKNGEFIGFFSIECIISSVNFRIKIGDRQWVFPNFGTDNTFGWNSKNWYAKINGDNYIFD